MQGRTAAQERFCQHDVGAGGQGAIGDADALRAECALDGVGHRALGGCGEAAWLAVRGDDVAEIVHRFGRGHGGERVPGQGFGCQDALQLPPGCGEGRWCVRRGVDGVGDEGLGGRDVAGQEIGFDGRGKYPVAVGGVAGAGGRDARLQQGEHGAGAQGCVGHAAGEKGEVGAVDGGVVGLAAGLLDR